MKNLLSVWGILPLCLFPLYDLLGEETNRDLEIIAEIQQVEARSGNPYSPYDVKAVAVRKLFYELSPESYELAAKKLIKPEDRTRTINYLIFRAWSQQNPEKAINYIVENELPWFTYSSTYDLLEQWAAKDPMAALAAAKKGGDSSRSLIEHVLRVVAVDDPSRALELRLSGQKSSGFIRDVIAYWATTDPEEAAKWIMTQEKRNDLLWHLGLIWSSYDRPNSAKWVATLQGDDHTHALAGMITERAEFYSKKSLGPLTAAEEFLAAFPEAALNQENTSNQRIKYLAELIAKRLPINSEKFTALEWILKLPPSQGRDQIFDEKMRMWAKVEPQKAREYIDGMPAGDRRDSALFSLLYVQWKSDPAVNFQLAMTILKENLRRYALADIFQQWLLLDPEVAVESLKLLEKVDQESVRELMKKKAIRSERQKIRES